ncbi:hypothetical protein J4459_03055 [Candidatus Woesearchaeota archaeon]|nr:hypothetical protein [Candidatus Woesearchaeota archaeon]
MNGPIYVMPISMNQGKKTLFFSLFKERIEIPAKELKKKIGKRHFYHFINQVKDINELVQNLGGNTEPMFWMEWGRDPITGRDIKIVKRDPKVNICNSKSDMVFVHK